ncbi:PRC-barrel domain-containing protein [Carboxydochorda subterranea]|uniref:PRC-barrel domain-containing protein n=1 Tax=Carboxydichorda subterranea TaxID=3109565 RepID=A0ABZ1BZD9_9FIRM|nr:PRC-barrel domain-containing protein [Limnochorda sp. L945t]WRP18176.1 PRC-barrel domain-containing protein [Limnochorda sp. L945t]
MVPSRRLLGLQVIDVVDGRALGRTSRLIFDPSARRLAAFVVSSGHWPREDQVLEWGRTRGVGLHAITVQGADTLVRPSALPELQPLLRRPLRLYGIRVLTEDGEFLGAADELMLDERSGAVLEVLLAPKGLSDRLRGRLSIAAASLLVMGEDAMVVRAGTRPTSHRVAHAGGPSRAGEHGAPPNGAPPDGAAGPAFAGAPPSPGQAAVEASADGNSPLPETLRRGWVTVRSLALAPLERRVRRAGR